MLRVRNLEAFVHTAFVLNFEDFDLQDVWVVHRLVQVYHCQYLPGILHSHFVDG